MAYWTTNKFYHYLFDNTLNEAHLEDDRLVVFLEIEGKDVCEHEHLPALTQHVDGFLQELHLDP